MAYIDFQSSRILEQLKRDNPKAVASTNGKHLNRLTCPACGKAEAFTYLDKPLAIICHRNNECGVSTPIKQVYPELFENFAQHFPPTPKDPKATARAYLESRGLNPELINFRQGYVDKHQTLVIEQDGVTFQRLIDYRSDGKGKNRLTPYSGKVFETAKVKDRKANETDIDSQTVFIVEAVIDALSLDQLGHAAIATYSSGAIPKDYYQNHKQHSFILAFDNDNAGISGIDKTITCFKELDINNYQIALPPKGKDWNDLLVDGQLDAEHIGKTLDTAYWQGRLTFAASPLAYFEIYRERYTTLRRLTFTFADETFKGFIGKNKRGEDLPPALVKIADCSIRLLHSIVDDNVEYQQKMQHVIELKSKREGCKKVKLNASETTKPDQFREVLQNYRQQFYGNGSDLMAIMDMLLNQQPTPPQIRAIAIIGYDEKSHSFYFPRFMYDPKGKRIELNKNGYFDNGIMPFSNCSDTIIKHLAPIDIKRFIAQLHGAYANKGLLALGFYIAALFSHCIFDHCGFFPFLSLYGDPHAGKSFLAKLLNRCFFMDGEGDTMTAANTQKAELRKISQKSSLVCSLLEGRKGKTRFDYDSILPLYNRNNLYSRATLSQDNRTHDLAFKGALSFVWNHELFELKPAKERVISLHFSENDLNEQTSAAWRELDRYAPEQLSGIGHYILSHREDFENRIIDQFKQCTSGLQASGINTTRIADNHAIALAGVQVLLAHIRVETNHYHTEDYAIERAKRKLETAKTDSDLADYFFNCIAEFDKEAGVATNEEALIVHLPTVLAHLQANNNGISNKSELIGELKRHDRFIKYATSRAISAKPIDCFFFKK